MDFDHRKSLLKVYCESSLYKSIVTKVRNSLSQVKSTSESISYKGKNLKAIIHNLDEIQQRVNSSKGKFCNYRVNYCERKIILTADFQTFEEAKNSIMKLVKKEKN